MCMGGFWCLRCDADYINKGVRCSVCGFIIKDSKHKRKNNKQILKDFNNEWGES